MQLIGKYNCEKCLDECSLCDNNSSCISCKDKFSLLDYKNSCICLNGYYKLNGICVRCPDNCTKCGLIKNKVNCTHCIDYHEIINGLCEPKCDSNEQLVNHECVCKEDYHLENNICVKIYFDLILKLDKNNKLSLNFEESLDTDLTDLLLEILTSVNIIKFKLKKESEKIYTMSFTFGESIINNTSFVLAIKRPIYSELSKTLKNYEYSLNFYEFIYVSDSMNKIIKNSKMITQILNPTSIFLSLLTNPSFAWLLINTLKIIYFIPLSRNPLTPAVVRFCRSVTDYNIMPNIPELYIKNNSTTLPFKEARDIGIDSSIVLINLESEITLLSLVVLTLPLILILAIFKLNCLNKFLILCRKNLRYSFFIRFWLQNHLILGVYSFLNFKAVNNS